MSRDIPTTEEELVSRDLLLHLRNAGRVIADENIADSPDIRFSENARLVGCECVQIPPSRIFKLMHTRFKQLANHGAKAIQIVWPQEPHVWTREAITTKNSKIPQYRENFPSAKSYLVIHTPISERDKSIRYADAQVLDLIRWAAQTTPHSFDEIYFWHQSGVERLWPASKQLPDPVFNFEGGYPCDGFLIGTAPFSTTATGAEPKVYDYGIVEPELLIIPPQGETYRKYSPRIERKSYRMKITAHDTSADITFDPVR